MRKLLLYTFLFFLLASAPLSALAYDTEHHWGPWIVDRAPTDVREGLEHRTCDKFPAHPHSESRAIPKLNHHVYKTTYQKPTCTSPGEKIQTCVYCGHRAVTKTAPPLGHDWGPWIVVKKATTASDGLKERTCKRCHEVEKASIPMLPAHKAAGIFANIHLNKTDAVVASGNTAFLAILALLTIPDILALLWYRKRRAAYRASQALRKEADANDLA